MTSREELIQVFTWLLDGKEVEYCYNGEWWGLSIDRFNALLIDRNEEEDYKYRYRLKPVKWKIGETVYYPRGARVLQGFVYDLLEKEVKVRFEEHYDWFDYRYAKENLFRKEMKLVEK